jgi:hypothetical protein
MGKMYNVFSAREDVSSVMGKVVSAEIERTGTVSYIPTFTGNPPWSILALLKKHLSIISSLAISDYVSPVPVVISDANIVKIGISPRKVLKN